MRPAKRPLLIAATILVLGALGLGFAAWRRDADVATQRREALARITTLQADILTAEDACWLAIHHYQSGEGLAGRAPLVECRGELQTLPGGYKLTRVLTQSGFMASSVGHDLCIARGKAWAIVGSAEDLEHCTLLPTGRTDDPAAAASRLVRERTATAVERAFVAIRTAMTTGAEPPDTCDLTAPLTSANTTYFDERRLDESFEPTPGTGIVIPHNSDFEVCRDPANRDPIAEMQCKHPRAWTHALVIHVRTLDPPKRGESGHDFTGGHATGELWLVDLAAARPVCRRIFKSDMPELVAASSTGTIFLERVHQSIREAARELTGVDLLR